MNKQSMLLAVSCLCAALLVACSGTKKIDGTDILKKPQDEKVSVAVYPDDVAGTVEDLYSDSSELEDSKPYQDAIAEDPALKYNIVYFAFDQVDLMAEGKDLVGRHASYLKEHPDVFVLLEGHADMQGSEGYNLALGERRANTVKNLLIFYGVSNKQISTISFGEEKPAVSGQTEEAYSKNRRVEIIYQ